MDNDEQQRQRKPDVDRMGLALLIGESLLDGQELIVIEAGGRPTKKQRRALMALKSQ